MIPLLALLLAAQPATISGKITDALTGAPLAHVNIYLHQKGPQPPATKSGPDGRYQLTGVPPGQWTITAAKPGFLVEKSEDELAVKPGEHLDAIDLQMWPAASISGQVVDEDGDPIDANIDLYAISSYAPIPADFHSHGQMDPATGGFRIDGLSPGPHFLKVIPTADPPPTATLIPAATWFPDAATFTDATPIDLGPGEHRTGLRLTLRKVPGFRIRGRIHEASSGADAVVSLFRDADGERQMIKQTTASPDGSFDFGPVESGDYRLHAFVPITVTNHIRELRVAISPLNDSDQPRAPVSTVQGDTAPGAIVSFTSEPYDPSPSSEFLLAHPTRTGRFSIQLPPGKYRAAAWTEYPPKLLMSPQYLAPYLSQTLVIELKPNETRTLHLDPIPSPTDPR